MNNGEPIMISYTLRTTVEGISPIVVRMYPKLWKFPGGEVGVQLQPYANRIPDSVNVTASLKNSDEFMQLIMFLDAAKRQFANIPINLYLPYLPYARQDRVCNDGESLSIAVIANIINSFNLASVNLFDVHSDVSLALFNNVNHIEQDEIWASELISLRTQVLIAPDAGAAKKIYKAAKVVGCDVVIANKERNVKTGEIVSVSIDKEGIRNKRCVVLDDICDGGRTFTELSGHIRGVVDSLTLCVTHGLFTKGEDIVCDAFDNVITTNSYANAADLKYVKVKTINID